jgi:hypothetical protein
MEMCVEHAFALNVKSNFIVLPLLGFPKIPGLLQSLSDPILNRVWLPLDILFLVSNEDDEQSSAVAVGGTCGTDKLLYQLMTLWYPGRPC